MMFSYGRGGPKKESQDDLEVLSLSISGNTVGSNRYRKSGGENRSSRGQEKGLYLGLCHLRDFKIEPLLWVYGVIGLAFESLRIKILKSVSLSRWWEEIWTHFNSICIWKSLKGAGNWEKADLVLHWVTGILKKYESGCYSFHMRKGRQVTSRNLVVRWLISLCV